MGIKEKNEHKMQKNKSLFLAESEWEEVGIARRSVLYRLKPKQKKNKNF